MKTVLCSKCSQEFTRGKYSMAGWLCEDCLGYRVKGKVEWVPERIKKDRRKYAKEMIQPYRENEFSKEFAKANPKRTKEMVKKGAITKEQVSKARNVWSDVKEIRNLKS